MNPKQSLEALPYFDVTIGSVGPTLGDYYVITLEPRLRRGDDQDDLQEVWRALAKLELPKITGLVVMDD
jgi:hypothetical protein